MSYVETYYSGTDFGNYSLLNNYIYKKGSDLVNIPANYYVNPDSDKKNINYSSLTMDYDDNGIRNGTDHNVYTPEEQYIILESIPKLSNIGMDVTLFPPNHSSGNPNSIEITIPCDGIFRYATSGLDSTDTLTKNDIKMDFIHTNSNYPFGRDGLQHTFPINVVAGDKIKISRNKNDGTLHIECYFLPYVYPWE